MLRSRLSDLMLDERYRFGIDKLRNAPEQPNFVHMNLQILYCIDKNPTHAFARDSLPATVANTNPEM